MLRKAVSWSVVDRPLSLVRHCLSFGRACPATYSCRNWLQLLCPTGFPPVPRTACKRAAACPTRMCTAPSTTRTIPLQCGSLNGVIRASQPTELCAPAHSHVFIAYLRDTVHVCVCVCVCVCECKLPMPLNSAIEKARRSRFVRCR